MSTPDTRTSDVESAAKTIMEDVKRHVEAVKVASFTEIYPIIEIYAEKSLTSFREKAVAEERERIVDAMHERYPVPDMNMAEVWPKDEQVRWAGIGEVMVYLQELTKRNI